MKLESEAFDQLEFETTWQELVKSVFISFLSSLSEIYSDILKTLRNQLEEVFEFKGDDPIDSDESD